MADIIYGRHAVLEALAAGESLLELHVAETAKPEGTLRTILNSARQQSVPIKWMPVQGLDREASAGGGQARHQGVVALLAGYRYSDLDEIVAASIVSGEDLFVLVLDAVQDVHNLGSLLRTAEAAGVHGVVLSDKGAAAVTPAVRKASAGAVAHLKVARTDLPAALDLLRARGATVVGLDEDAPVSVYEVPLAGPLVLVVGGEARGLRPAVERRLDAAVSVPMRGSVASLNASVAGSIVLFEVVRQRGLG